MHFGLKKPEHKKSSIKFEVYSTEAVTEFVSPESEEKFFSVGGEDCVTQGTKLLVDIQEHDKLMNDRWGFIVHDPKVGWYIMAD